jgi:hypothetical protein
MKLFIIIVISFLKINVLLARLYFIEVKYPLLVRILHIFFCYNKQLKYLTKGHESKPGSPWPMPKFMNQTTDNLYYFNKNTFKILTNMQKECDIIESNKKIYSNILFPPKMSFDVEMTTNLLNELNIEIKDFNNCPGYPGTDMDESCNNFKY